MAGYASGIPAPAIPSPAAPVHEALAVLEQFGTRQAVRRGHEIYAAGDAARFCYRIVSGSVRTVGLDEDGRRQIAEFLLPGDLLGFNSLDTHHLSAEALTDTVVLRYPRGVIDTLAEQHGALALRLRSLTMQNLGVRMKRCSCYAASRRASASPPSCWKWPRAPRGKPAAPWTCRCRAPISPTIWA